MKRNVKRILGIIFVFTMLLVCSAVCASAIEVDESKLNGAKVAEKIDYNVVPGISESYIVLQNDDGTNQVTTYVLEIDLTNPEIGILASYKNYMNDLAETPEWGMQAVRDQAAVAEDYYNYTVGNKDFEVIAGINADFFNMTTGSPLGALVMNGITYNTATSKHNDSYFAILDDGTAVIGKGDVPSNTVEAIGGSNFLVKDGAINPAIMSNPDKYPRTSIGLTADGKVIFVTSDGRQAPAACGQTFTENAYQMLSLGCVVALQVDGGGSSTFVTQRDGEDHLSVRNCPADGIERTVSSALLVYTNKDTNKYTNTSKWFDNNGKIGYYDAEGYVVTGTQTIDGFTYEFDADGVLQSFAVVNVDGSLAKNVWANNKYYLGADGLPVKGEYTVNGVKFVFNNSGKLVSSELTEKWCKLGDDVCYFGEDGKLVSGTVKIDGYTYKFTSGGVLKVFASVKSDGTLVKNTWIGSDYYLGEDGLPVTGTQKITCNTSDGKTSHTYTFDSNGKFVKGAFTKSGVYSYYWIAGLKQRNWFEIDGYWYYFDRQTGYGMATVSNDGKINADKVKDGKYPISSTDSKLLFEFDTKGRLTKGSWLDTGVGKVFYWGNHQRLIGWQVIDGYIYYFNNDTYAETGKAVIGGKSYTFDAEGRLTGAGTRIEIDGTVYEIDASLKVAHTYTSKVVAPGCVDKGYTEFVCSDCGYSYKTSYVDAIGQHNMQVKEVVAPTCLAKGYTVYECSVCTFAEKKDYTDKAAHNMKVKEVVAPGCLTEGYTVYECSVCTFAEKKDYTDAAGHNMKVKEVVAPTCLVDGYTRYECSDCGLTKDGDTVKATGHNMQVKEIVAPTCLVDGYTKYECADCGLTKDGDTVKATGHNMQVKEVVAPTCLVDGYTRYECSGCGLTQDGDTVDATGHNMQVKEVIAPTCEMKGYTRYECSDCGLTSDGDTVDAAGHKPGEWVKVDDTTERKFCTVCEKCVDERSVEIKLPGDANKDGKITAADARLVLRIAAQIDEMPENIDYIDMNADKKITSADARLVLRKAAQID